MTNRSSMMRNGQQPHLQTSNSRSVNQSSCQPHPSRETGRSMSSAKNIDKVVNEILKNKTRDHSAKERHFEDYVKGL